MITEDMRNTLMAQAIIKDCFRLCEDLAKHISSLPQFNADLMCAELGTDTYLKLRATLQINGYDNWIDCVCERTEDYFESKREDQLENHRAIFWAVFSVTGDIRDSHDKLHETYLKLRRSKKKV